MASLEMNGFKRTVDSNQLSEHFVGYVYTAHSFD